MIVPRLSPEEVANRTFPSARRGVDPESVRRFLEEVGNELRRAHAREAELRSLLADAERRAASPELDEATLTAAVGLETARVLKAAHEAAREVVTKAEAQAAEVVAEAEGLLAEHRSGAEREAERLLDATRQECRVMIEEAREARRRILADLAGRRRELHVQLEQIRAAKDALARVVDAVAAEVDQIRARVASAEEEARRAAEGARLDGAVFADEPSIEALVAEALAGVRPEDELAADQSAEDEAAPDDGRSATATSVDELAQRHAEEAGDNGEAGEAGAEWIEEAEEAPVLRLVGREPDAALSALVSEPVGERLVESAGLHLLGEDGARRDGDPLDGDPLDGPLRDGASPVAEPGVTLEVPPSANGDGPVPTIGPWDRPPLGEIESAVPPLSTVGTDDSTTAFEAPLLANDEAPDPTGAMAEHDAQGERAGKGQEDREAPSPNGVGAAVAANPSAERHGPPSPFSAPSRPSASAVDELFARIRASRADEVAQAHSVLSATSSPDGPPQVVSPTAFEPASQTGEPRERPGALRREEEDSLEQDAPVEARHEVLLAPCVAELARALKRGLRSEQNEQLAAARDWSGGDASSLLPDAAMSERLAQGALGSLAAAREAGVRFVGEVLGLDTSELTISLEAGTIASLASSVVEHVVRELGDRLASELSSLADAEGAGRVVGAAYREWKGERVEQLAHYGATQAFSSGVLAGATACQSFVRWSVGEVDQPCADCDDNALAGVQAPGEAFPTGQVSPPLHMGCRCVLVPVAT